MSKYIEIGAAIEAIYDVVELYPSEYASIADALRNLPVDATVETVNCEACMRGRMEEDYDIEDDVIDEEAEIQGELKKYVALDDVLKLREIFPYDEKGDTHFTLGIASACEYAEHLPAIEVMKYRWPEKEVL